MTRAQFFQAVQAIVAVFDDPNIQPPDVQNIIDTVKIVLAQDKKTVNGGEDLMPSIATITGKIGPGTTLTSVVYNNVTLLSLDTFNEALTIEFNNGDGVKKVVIDVSAQTTWTLTVSGNNYTLTVT